jgi:hypothetical protein
MRCMMAHRTNAYWESGAIPTPALVARVGGMIGEMVEAGVLLAAEGLRPSSQGARVTFANGKRTIVKGPYLGSNELLASFAVVRVAALEDAIEWATQLAALTGDMEVDIRPVSEPWDIGASPAPAGLATRRYMVAQKADRNSEQGVPLTARRLAEIGDFFDESSRRGVLLASERLAPSSRAVRFLFSGGRNVKTDGPFAETRELLGGFVIVNVQSMDAALDWAPRYAAAVGDIELDVHPLDQVLTRRIGHGTNGT